MYKIRNPIIGHIYAIFDHPIGSILGKWLETIPNNGLLRFHGVLGAEYVVVASAKGLSDVLTHRAYDFEKATALRRFSARFIGKGLAVEEGDSHRLLRKLVSPVFLQRRIDSLKPIISYKARQLAQLLRSLASDADASSKLEQDGQNLGPVTVDIGLWTSRVALDIACVIGLGIDPNTVSDAKNELFAAYNTIFGCSEAKKQHFMWHNSAPSWLMKLFPSSIDAEMDEAYAIARTVVRKITDARFEAEGGKSSVTEAEASDYLTTLVRSGSLSPETCVEQCLMILAAG